ncbi:MAG TPA: hypothetical protein VGE34_01075 [Candidatus Saccharimonadales bacterium]
MEAYHTQDEEMRGVDLSADARQHRNLGKTVSVLESLHEEFGENRDGTDIIPGVE